MTAILLRWITNIKSNGQKEIEKDGEKNQRKGDKYIQRQVIQNKSFHHFHLNFIRER